MAKPKTFFRLGLAFIIDGTFLLLKGTIGYSGTQIDSREGVGNQIFVCQLIVFSSKNWEASLSPSCPLPWIDLPWILLGRARRLVHRRCLCTPPWGSKVAGCLRTPGVWCCKPCTPEELSAEQSSGHARYSPLSSDFCNQPVSKLKYIKNFILCFTKQYQSQTIYDTVYAHICP